LGANLVTLSGCATGMNFVDAGDELMGLQRGLFRAGAATLMLSLWDVHDRTTADLMVHFYTSWTQTHNPAKSLQNAMGKIRESHPHPYFWAPFILTGKIAESTPLR
jgi:CHAT domain-containing protein